MGGRLADGQSDRAALQTDNRRFPAVAATRQNCQI